MDLVEYYRKADTVVGIAKILFNEIQNKYESKRISQLAKTTSGGTPNRGHSEYYGGNIPWLKSGELNDAYIEKSEEFITEEGLKNSSATLFKKDTLLVAMYGATAGKTGILKLDATTNQAVCGFYELNGIERDYLYWFLRQYRIDFILQSKGGAQPNISQTVIKNTLIPFPPIEIQKQIIQFLDTVEKENSINVDYDFIDDNFDKNVTKYFGVRNTNETLEKGFKTQSQLLSQLRQSILQEAIQGKLTKNWRAENPNTESAETLLQHIKSEKEKLIKEKKIKVGKKQASNDIGNIKFELPKDWIFVELDDITQFITDGTHQTPKYTEKGRVFLSAQNVKPFKFMPENHKYVSEEAYQEFITGKEPEKGDLLVGRVGSKGETAVIDREIDFAYYVSLGLVKTFKEFTSPEYLAIVMNSPFGNRYAVGNMSSIGTAAGNFNLGRIRSFPIPLPPLSEQHAIVEQVEKLLGKCTALQAEIENLNAHSQTLLKALFAETFATETA